MKRLARVLLAALLAILMISFVWNLYMLVGLWLTVGTVIATLFVCALLALAE